MEWDGLVQACEHPETTQEHQLLWREALGAQVALCITAEFPGIIGFDHSVISSNNRKLNCSHSPVGCHRNLAQIPLFLSTVLQMFCIE